MGRGGPEIAHGSDLQLACWGRRGEDWDMDQFDVPGLSYIWKKVGCDAFGAFVGLAFV